MSKLLSKPYRVITHIVLSVLILLGLAIMLVPEAEVGFLLLLLTVVTSIVGLLSGMVTALGLTLLLYFLIGSSYFWLLFTNNIVFDHNIPNMLVLIWMVCLLFIAILMGRIGTLLKDISLENESLKEEVRTLVAVDPVTGFDNKDRMFIELESEFNRSKRYDQIFLFLLIKIEYIEQFHKLYGEHEYINMLQHIAKEIHNNTRSSDLKFRPEANLFALILPHTPSEHSQLIVNKLNQALRTFQLQNKRIVTLNFQFGYASFEQDLDDFLVIYNRAKEQVSYNVS